MGNSVPERAFYGTEYACRAQKGFLGYATHFQKSTAQERASSFWRLLYSVRAMSPFSGSLKNSVPERAFSGTEYACCAKKGFLRYATRFLKHSVRRTGFCGTEGIFGTGNALLWYGVHLQSAGCLASPHVAPQKEKSASGQSRRPILCAIFH